MKHAIAVCTVLVSALAFTAIPAQAQDTWPISFDVRGGYAFPIGDFGDTAESDWGFGAGAVLTLTESIGIYGGWAQDSFNSEVGETDINISGFEAGGKLVFPREEGALPWAKAGVIAQKMEFDAGNDLVDSESDREWGFQAAVGMDVPLGEVISVSPSLRYNNISFGEGDDFFDDDPSVQFLSIDIGAHIHIPRM